MSRKILIALWYVAVLCVGIYLGTHINEWRGIP